MATLDPSSGLTLRQRRQREELGSSYVGADGSFVDPVQEAQRYNRAGGHSGAGGAPMLAPVFLNLLEVLQHLNAQ